MMCSVLYMHICNAFSCSMHTGRVTEYVKVLAKKFLETLCRYVCMYVCMYTHTKYTHILWFSFLLMLENCSMDHCQYLCIGFNFFLFQLHCIWYWMYGIIIIMWQTLCRLRQNMIPTLRTTKSKSC